MLSNRIIVHLARILVLVLVSIILADLLFSSLSGSLSDYFEGHWPAIVSGTIIAVMIALNLRYFSFSDDHEFIHIQTRSGLLPIAEAPAEINFEFLKKNIADYHISGWGSYQKLYIKLSSEYRGKDEYHFAMSFISGDQAERIRTSLKRAIQKSSKQPHAQLASVG
jgi:hypothetical protein